MSRLSIRQDPRPAIRRAVMALVAANQGHPFVAGVSGRLEYRLGRKDWPYPYATFAVWCADRSTRTAQIDVVQLQVSVFSRASLEAEILSGHATALFTTGPLSAEGICPFTLRRFGEVPTFPDAATEKTVAWQAGYTLVGLVQTKP